VPASDHLSQKELNRHELSLGQQALQAQLSLLDAAERSDKPAVQKAAIAMARKVRTPYSSRISTPIATVLALGALTLAGGAINHAVNSYKPIPATVVTISTFGLLFLAIAVLGLFSGHLPAERFMKLAAWTRGYFSTVVTIMRGWFTSNEKDPEVD
jgi:hypothetical protein